MDIAENFNFVGAVDVSALRQQINTLDEMLWHQDGYRQRQYKIHQQTHTIPLLFDMDGRYIQPTRQPAFVIFEDNIKPILAAASRHLEPDSYLLRLLLTRLPAGTQIGLHQDKGSTLRFAHRMHVAVITHPDVIFQVGDEQRNLAAGEIWEINNCRTHGVTNFSDVNRVHLIMDWVTPSLARQHLRHRLQAAGS